MESDLRPAILKFYPDVPQKDRWRRNTTDRVSQQTKAFLCHDPLCGTYPFKQFGRVPTPISPKSLLRGGGFSDLMLSENSIETFVFILFLLFSIKGMFDLVKRERT